MFKNCITKITFIGQPQQREGQGRTRDNRKAERTAAREAAASAVPPQSRYCAPRRETFANRNFAQ